MTTVPWGFRVDGQVRHASQLYEAGLEGLVLFAVLWLAMLMKVSTAGITHSTTSRCRASARISGISAPNSGASRWQWVSTKAAIRR